MIKLHFPPGRAGILMSMQYSIVGANGTMVESNRQRKWQNPNTCNLNDVSKWREGGRTTGKTNNQEAFKCSADTGTSKYAQRLSAIHPIVLVTLKVRSSVMLVIQCQSHMTRATMVGLHSVSNAFQERRVQENDIGACMNQEPPPPPGVHTLKPQCWHFHNSDNQICLEDLDEKGLLMCFEKKKDKFQLFRRMKSKIAFECQISAHARRCKKDGKRI